MQETQKYVEEMQKFHVILLRFLEESDDSIIFFQLLINFIGSHNYSEDHEELLHFLRLLTFIASNHHRRENFLKKIEQILDKYSIQFKQSLTNIEIYDIVKENKVILLYFIQKDILKLNKEICYDMIEKVDKNGLKYCHFFYKEIEEKFGDFIEQDKIKKN
ncbi:hypothetical protein M9Y10_006201 [Tritrichomonas musculus]|uniref:Uncharacterized protein n=1 Tax=Tritrichomonas musculus TaxID=1915356 RepID=A0ABR2JEQ0_9EUKA